MKFDTKCVKAYFNSHELGACIPSLNMSVIYNLGEKESICYRRYNNENSKELSLSLQSIYGTDKNVVLTNCGLTAYVFMCLRYPNCRRVMAYDIDDECQGAVRMVAGETVFVDMHKIDDFVFRPNDMVFCEPISNPMLVKYDIKHICDVCHKHNAKVIVDNSLLSVANYNPLNDGADIVLESGTKWLSGSGDAMLGILIGTDIPSSIYQIHGLSPNPLDCYLVHKGIPTLPIRMERIRKNAKPVAEYIKTLTPYVSYDERIGMITFCLGDNDYQREFCSKLKLFFWGAVFGQNNSTIQNSNFGKVAYLNPPFNWCLRISVGLEDAEDLIKDLEQAYKTTKGGRIISL